MELQNEDCLLSLCVRNFLLQLGFKLLALLPFGLKLRISVFFLSLQSSGTVLDLTLVLLPFAPDALFVARDCAFELLGEIVGLLFGEVNLLVLERPLALVVNLALGQIVFLLFKLRLELGNLVLQI